jgi:hypothetical protein
MKYICVRNFSCCTNENGLKGQKQSARGNALGEEDEPMTALTGQKPYRCHNVFAPSGRNLLRYLPFTQGVALGWYLVGLSGRLCTKSILTAHNFHSYRSKFFFTLRHSCEIMLMNIQKKMIIPIFPQLIPQNAKRSGLL